MNKRSLGALIALNIVLLLTLAVLAFQSPTARAQGAGPSSYIMVSGEVAGRNNQALTYIIELRSSRMVGVLFNSSNNTIEVIGGRTISTDMAGGGGR